MLTKEVIDSIQECVLCWLATTDKNGIPNVSPKEMFINYGHEILLIANIASPNSVQNLNENANACVSFVHIFKQKGYKLKGRADIIQPENELFHEYQTLLYSLGGSEFPIQNIIAMKIDEISTIVAPSYWMLPDTTEEIQIAQALQTYGVDKIK